ncbi:cell morphogenesis N-terminal-domain-containing protein [Apiospora arundinis]
MSTTLNAAAAVFDPQLSASLQNEILRRGWEALATGLPYEESTATWWELYGLECDATGVTSRLAPQLIEFLKQARHVRPGLGDQVPIDRNFFYYLTGISSPRNFFSEGIGWDPEEPDADRWICLYRATSLMSHPVGILFDQHTLKSQLQQSLTIDNTIVEESQRPWVPLQDIFAAYLEMNDLGKMALEDPRPLEDEYIRQNYDAMMAGTWKPKLWPFKRPWLMKPHSQAILDRSAAALGKLVDAIEKRMPSPKSKDEKTTDIMSMASAAENLVSTGQAFEDSFLVKFLRQVDGLLTSARPELLFVAPGLRLPTHDDLAMTQPLEGVENERQWPPILLFRGELSSGTATLTTFPVGTWNPFLDPYQNHIKQTSSAFPSGLWISEHNKDNPNYDDSCRLLLPDQVVLGTRRHHAKTTDGFLLEQPPGQECEGLAAGLYQTSCNVFEGRHEVELFRVLEHWIQQVEDGTWDVDERGVAGGMEKWAEADESEVMAEKYRLPYTW